MYEGDEGYCKCGLKASRYMAYNLELYFGCLVEQEGKSCGSYEKLKVRELEDAIRREKDKVFKEKNKEIRHMRLLIQAIITCQQ
ncbi:hypothetical protein LINPERPRIM_LOCUS2197 [Linum perenne]